MNPFQFKQTIKRKIGGKIVDSILGHLRLDKKSKCKRIADKYYNICKVNKDIPNTYDQDLSSNITKCIGIYNNKVYLFRVLRKNNINIKIRKLLQNDEYPNFPYEYTFSEHSRNNNTFTYTVPCDMFGFIPFNKINELSAQIKKMAVLLARTFI